MRRRALSTLLAGALGGCAHYAPAPLHSAGQALAAADMAALNADAEKIDRPFLKPQSIDLSRPLTPNALAVIAVLENPDLKALRTAAGVTDAQAFAARLLPDPTVALSADRVISGPDDTLGLGAQVIDYRLVPKNIYPDFVEDSVSAIAWVYQHAGQYGGDPNMIFVLGHSAGAFNAVAAVDDERFWSKSDVPDGAIKGVIGLAGPYSYDFRQFDSRVAFPTNMLPEQIMPDSHVRPNAPPHYLLVAEKDTLVGIKNLMKMKRGLERANVPVRTAVIPKVNHYTMIVALATPGRWLGQTRQMVLDYLAERVHAESAS